MDEILQSLYNLLILYSTAMLPSVKNQHTWKGLKSISTDTKKVDRPHSKICRVLPKATRDYMTFIRRLNVLKRHADRFSCIKAPLYEGMLKSSWICTERIVIVLKVHIYSTHSLSLSPPPTACLTSAMLGFILNSEMPSLETRNPGFHSTVRRTLFP